MYEKRDYLTPKQARVLVVLARSSFGVAKEDIFQACNNDGLGEMSRSAFVNAVTTLRDRGYVEIESPFNPMVHNKIHSITEAGRAALEDNLGTWRRLIWIYGGET